MAAIGAMKVNVDVRCEASGQIRRGSHVTSLVTGFHGQVIEERHVLHGRSQMLVAPPVQVGRRAGPPRWIDVRQLRVDRPIRRKNAPTATVRYAIDAQEAIVDALFDFAESLRMRPSEGLLAQRPDDSAGVSLTHVETALDRILAGFGYVKAEE
jgi:hypothetical protein